MSVLYVLIGPPGVGKTTWREERSFMWDVGTMKYGAKSIVTISQDDLVEEYAQKHGLTYSEAFKQADLKAFDREVRRRFEEAVKAGRNIILDRTNMTRKSRSFFIRTAKDHKRIAVVFKSDPAVLDDRLERRARETGKHIPGHVVRQMLKSYQEPIIPEFDEIRTVDTALVPTFRQALRHLWRRWRGTATVF